MALYLGAIIMLISVLSLFFQYKELKNSLPVLKHAYDFKYRQIPYPFNYELDKKVGRRANLYLMILHRYVFGFSYLFLQVIHTAMSVYAYLDPVNNHNPVLAIFWYVIVSVSVEQCMSGYLGSHLNMVCCDVRSEDQVQGDI